MRRSRKSMSCGPQRQRTNAELLRGAQEYWTLTPILFRCVHLPRTCSQSTTGNAVTSAPVTVDRTQFSIYPPSSWNGLLYVRQQQRGQGIFIQKIKMLQRRLLSISSWGVMTDQEYRNIIGPSSIDPFKLTISEQFELFPRSSGFEPIVIIFKGAAFCNELIRHFISANCGIECFIVETFFGQIFHRGRFAYEGMVALNCAVGIASAANSSGLS